MRLWRSSPWSCLACRELAVAHFEPGQFVVALGYVHGCKPSIPKCVVFRGPWCADVREMVEQQEWRREREKYFYR